ncbi:hypothetical protein Anas_14044 [Armadillidium nasatum]|uniref:Uncharacterized protein n=1 Tax=Armadillidium nasatum TaxID=96803 RepID=A0A5N5T265_9CRUS|nr:hypothetical protein Anas_14044 [Armadillidium nasatum]
MEGSKIEEELNGGGVISMCSCTEYQITYQIRLTLTSTFDDMRCTLLRLLEKVKNLELKNSLDVIKFLNITSHNADGSGNLLEEGIPEVIPKKRLSMLLFYWFRFGLEDIQ